MLATFEHYMLVMLADVEWFDFVEHFHRKEISVKGVLNTMELSIGIIYLLKQKMQIPLTHLKGF